MRKQHIIVKILSGLLSISMLFQSMSVSVSAHGYDTVETVISEEGKEPETTDIGNISNGDASGAEETSAEVKEENDSAEKGKFVTVKVSSQKGFHITFDRVEYCPATPENDVKLFTEQYNSDNEIVDSSVMELKQDTETGNRYNENFSVMLLKDTSYIKIKASEYENGSLTEISTVYYENMIERTAKLPDIVFSKAEQRVGAGSLTVFLEKTGKLYQDTQETFYVDLLAGESEDSDTWKNIASSSFYVKDSSEGEISVIFQGIPADATYYGKLHIYIENQEKVHVYDQIINLDLFTTLTEEDVLLEETFPDEVLRTAVLKALENTYSEQDFSQGIATRTQLEGISFLTYDRTSYQQPAIKDLTGITYLSNLTSIALRNNEIEDISPLLELKSLKSIYIDGNEVKDAVDFSGLKGLQFLSINENRLNKENFEAIQRTCNGKVDCSDLGSGYYMLTKQRTDVYGLVSEEKYYTLDGTTNIYFAATGYKTNLGYTFKFKINGKEITGDKTWNSFESYRYVANDLEVGSQNTITVEYYAGTTLVGSKTNEFTIAEEEVYTDGNFYTREGDSSISVYLYDMRDDRKAKSIAVVNDEDVTVAIVNNIEWGRSYGMGSRYSWIFGASDLEAITYYRGAAEALGDLPAGDYHLRVVFENGEQATIKNVVHVIEKNKSVVISGYMSTGYNNTKDYYYAYLKGYNIRPEEITYSLKDSKAIEENLTYISSKCVTDGVIVKLKKNMPTKLEVFEYLQLKSDTVQIVHKSSIVFFRENMFYTAFNSAKKVLEVGISAGEDGDTVTVELKKGSNGDAETYGITGQGIVKDGIAYISLYREDKSPVETLPDGSYYVHAGLGENTYVRSFTMNNVPGTEDTWYIYTGHRKNAGLHYQSAMPYDQETGNTENYHFETEVDGERKKLNGTISVTEQDGYAKIHIDQPVLDDFAIGKYPVYLYYKEELLASAFFEIVDESIFRISDIQVDGWGKQTRLYISTPDIADCEKLTFTFRDYEGKRISGVEIVDLNIYEDSGYLYFTGLEQYRMFYVYIEHKDKGTAYAADGQNPYFTEENGKLLKCVQQGNDVVTFQGKIVGIRINPNICPITVDVYKPYDTEKVTITRTIQAESVDNNIYYFDRSFAEGLPDADGYYEICISDVRGKTVTYRGVLGFKAQEETNTWSASLDRNTVNIDETATVTYTGRYEVSIESEDSTVAVIQKAGDSTYLVLPLKAGCTNIRVTAKGETRTFPITVTAKVRAKGISLDKSFLRVIEGDKGAVLTVLVTPAESLKDGAEITATSSNNKVAAVDILEETETGYKILVTPVADGTAEITVRVTGTELKTSCTVQVMEAIDIEAEKQKVGKLYALLNTTDGKPLQLKNVKLPEEWSWVDGEVTLTADDGAKCQNFDAVLARDGYEPITIPLSISIGKITGVFIEGEQTLLQHASAGYTLGFQCVGYSFTYQEVKDLITMDWTGSKNLFFNSISGNYTNIMAGGVIKDTKESIKVSVTINGKTRLNATRNITVLAEQTVNRVEVTVSDSVSLRAVEFSLDKESITVDMEKVEPKKKDTILLTAKAYADEEKKNTVLNWKVADTKVASIKTDKTGREVQIVIKKSGRTVITVTAKDSGAYCRTFVLDVRDYNPILADTKITLNQYLTDGVTIPYYVQNGNEVVDAVLYMQQKNGIISKLTDLNLILEDGILRLSTDNIFSKNVVYKDAVLKLTGQNGKDYAYKVTITVDTKKPVVKISQEKKLNLFYTDAEAVFALKTDAVVAEVTDVTVKDEEEPGLYISAVDAENKKFVLTCDGVTPQNVAGFQKNGMNKALRITFAGYKDSAAQVITVKVANEIKPEKYSVTDVKFTENMLLSASIINATTKKIVSGEKLSGCTITVVKPAEGLHVDLNGNRLDMVWQENRNTAYELTLAKDNWTRSIVVKGKLTAVKQAEVQTDAKEILLNTDTNIQRNGYVKTGISLVGSNTEVNGAFFSGKNAAAVSLLDTGALSLSFNPATQEIEAGLNEGYTVKAGTYTYIMVSTAKTEKGVVPVKDKVITVKIVDGIKNRVKLTVSKKGSLNLADRTGTMITYTPKLTNMSARITGVKLTGASANGFEAKVENGNIVVHARENADLSSKITYRLIMHVELDNGYEGVSTEVKIKPTVKYPKVTVSVKKAVIYKATDKGVTFSLSVDQKNSKGQIKEVVLQQDKTGISEYFCLEKVDKENLTYCLQLKEEGKTLTADKAYTLNLRVVYEKDSYDASPQTIKLPVVLK